MKKLVSILCLASSTLLLSACSQEPNQQDLTQAITTVFQQASNNMIQIQLISLEKLGSCVKRSDGKTYDCDIKVTSKNSVTGTQVATKKFPFVKSDNGQWVAIDENK